MNSGILTISSIYSEREHGTTRWWENTIVLFGWVASRLGSRQTSQLELGGFDVRGSRFGHRAGANANMPSRIFWSNAQRHLFFFLDQLFPNSSLLVLLLQSLFLLSGLRWNILIFLAGCFIVSQRQSFICVCVCTSFAYRQYILSSLCKIISL